MHRIATTRQRFRAHHALGPSPRDGREAATPQERHARGLRHGAALPARRLEREPAALSRDCTNNATHDAAERVAGCVEINQCVRCTRQFFTKSFLSDGVAALALSSGKESA